MNEKIEIRQVKANESIKKNAVIREVAQITGQTQGVVRDVLNAFTDVAQREMIITGAFDWKGLPTVTSQVRKSCLRYQEEIDKTLLYPETCYLTAKVPEPVKKLHREMFRVQTNEENGTTPENWWEPYVYCDGDYKKKK